MWSQILKDRLRAKDGQWSEALKQCALDCNRLSDVFAAVSLYTAVPACDWSTTMILCCNHIRNVVHKVVILFVFVREKQGILRHHDL